MLRIKIFCMLVYVSVSKVKNNERLCALYKQCKSVGLYVKKVDPFDKFREYF